MGRDYRDLIVWQKAMDLAEHVYVATKRFPIEERYVLTSQMRRCSVSVASNIAEGQGRLTAGEFRQFLSHALGSVRELETQLLLATRLDYLAKEDSSQLIRETSDVARLINRLAASNLSRHGDYVREARTTKY